MPLHSPEQSELHREILSRVLESLKDLHATSVGEMSDEHRVIDGMNKQIIGETTRTALSALIEKEEASMRIRASQEQWAPDQIEREITAMVQRLTEKMFEEHWYESTLSTLEYPIHSATFGESKFKFELRMLMAENPSLERLQEFAWIMFDVNGLRSFKDCTSHPTTTQFLKGIVRILVDPGGPTHRKLAALGIRVIPMATGGDEFELYLRGTSPISQKLIDEIIASFQEEISSSSELRSFLDFDDPLVLIKYGWPSADERHALNDLPGDEQHRLLQSVRLGLPPKNFIPSMAGGGCNLVDGILYAVDRDLHDLRKEKDFSTLRGKVVQGTTDLAKDRQDANKKKDKTLLERTDPLQARFLARGQENREQERIIHEQSERIRQLEQLFGRGDVSFEQGGGI